MTVKELAEFTGNTERNIQYWTKKARMGNSELAKKLAKTVSSAGHGKPADFDLDEVELILNNSTLPPLVVKVLMQNARNNQSAETSALSKDKSSSLERAFEMMARAFETIAETQKMQESRLHKIEERIEERQALLPAPQIKPRDHINMLVRFYVSESGLSYKDCWRELYRQFGYRTNTNPKKCAENRGMGILDYIETEGQIETLEAVAMEIFGTGKITA